MRGPAIIAPNLMLIGRQVTTDYGKFIDLLAVAAAESGEWRGNVVAPTIQELESTSWKRCLRRQIATGENFDTCSRTWKSTFTEPAWMKRSATMTTWDRSGRMFALHSKRLAATESRM